MCPYADTSPKDCTSSVRACACSGSDFESRREIAMQGAHRALLITTSEYRPEIFSWV